MNTTWRISFVFGVVAFVITVAGLWWWTQTVPMTSSAIPGEFAPVVTPTVPDEDVRVTSPGAGELVTSPLTVVGEARGTWFFEASFPLVLVDWDGKIIAEGYATAQSDWMTTDFVPFTAVITFLSPYRSGDPDFMNRGTLILKKDNPSGLSEYDDAREILVTFAPSI